MPLRRIRCYVIWLHVIKKMLSKFYIKLILNILMLDQSESLPHTNWLLKRNYQCCYKQQGSNIVRMLLLSRFSRVQLIATPWTAAHQAPPSMRFSRQEYWSGLPLPSPWHPRGSQNKGITNICNEKKANIDEQKLKMEVPVKKKEIMISYLVPQPQSVSRPRIHWLKRCPCLQDWQHHSKYIL